MALQQTITQSIHGEQISFSNAYIKIERLEGDKDFMYAHVFVRKNTGGVVLERRKYGFNPQLDGSNFIAQAYEHIKALPEYADATDI